MPSLPPRPGRKTPGLCARLGCLALALAAAASSAWAAPPEDIIDVLRRSQEHRLRSFQAATADSARAAAVQRSFERLQAALPQPLPAGLLVVRGGTIAETLHGHIVVAREVLGDMPERVRLFILAHELGHVALHHWEQTARLYQRWIPGEVRPDTTDPVAGALGREASAQAHRQAFAADAWAAQRLQGLGLQHADLLLVFQNLGSRQDTATHPAARHRLAALREQLTDDRP